MSINSMTWIIRTIAMFELIYIRFRSPVNRSRRMCHVKKFILRNTCFTRSSRLFTSINLYYG